MEKLTAFAAELFELLVLVVAAGAASAAGIALESYSYAAVTGGDLVVGLWAAGMGLVALYAGLVALGYEQVLPRLRAFAQSS